MGAVRIETTSDNVSTTEPEGPSRYIAGHPRRTSGNGGSGVRQIVIALKLAVQGAALRQPNPVVRVQSEELLDSLAHLTPEQVALAAKRSRTWARRSPAKAISKMVLLEQGGGMPVVHDRQIIPRVHRATRGKYL